MDYTQDYLIDYGRVEPMESPSFFSQRVLRGEGFHIGLLSVIFSLLPFTLAGIALVAGLPRFAMIVAGIWVFVLIVVSPGAGIALLLSTQVLDQAMNPETGGGYGWISPVRVMMLLCVLSYVIRLPIHRPDIHANKGVLIILFIFILQALFPLLLAESKRLGFLAITKMLIQILLVMAAVDTLSEPKKLVQTLLFVVMGGAVGSLFITFSGIAASVEAEHRLAIAGGLGINAVAISLGAFIVATIVLLLLRCTVFTLAVAIVASLLMMLTVLRTGTRSVIIAVPAAIIFGALVGYWKKLHKLFLIGLIGIVISGGVLYWAVQSDFIRGDLKERILSIFSSQTYKENVRLRLWTDAIGIYMGHPMGVGPGNEPVYYEKISTEGALVAHNTFLSVLIEYNIIGFALFVSAFMIMGFSLLRIKNKALRAGAGMIFAFSMLNALKGTMHETRLFWQPILLVMVIIETNYRIKRKVKEETVYVDEESENYALYA